MAVPAGWYADGADPHRLRWWDGSAWTDRTKLASEATAHPPAAPTTAETSRSAAIAGTTHVDLQSEVSELLQQRDALRREIVEMRETVLLQEVGIYEYSHPLDDSDAYKTALDVLEAEMKESVKDGRAVRGISKWAINGDEKQGGKMVADICKLMLRAYNSEADNLVRSMRPYALPAAAARLNKMRDAVSKLGKSMRIEITPEYHALKTKELELTADYLAKVADEKERERDARRRLKEEEQALAEIEREKAKLEKEKEHYANVAAALHQSGNEVKAAEAEAKISEISAAIAGVAERAANVRAGYVYIVSNVGSFGGSIVKIGMTRRLDPLDRVRELGDASVPFRFDVHATIFSEDAVGLESALHSRFADERVNLVNFHREYFFTTPERVREALRELKGEILSFVSTPEALEWHQSATLRRRTGVGFPPPPEAAAPP
jgi:hypothetical protein